MAAAALTPGAPPGGAGPDGVGRQHRPWLARLNAWRKHSPFNPYWIEVSWLRRSARILAPRARGVLLDVGGGERPYEELFAPHVQRYWSLEYPVSAEALVPGISGRPDRIRGVVDVWGDGGRLPVRDGSVDTVLSFEVLEHVPDPQACVREFARVLRPGGALLLTVPFAAPLHQLPFDFQRFTAGGIRSLLERNGLEVESVLSRGNFSSTTGSVLAHWILRTLGARGRHHDGSATLSRWRAPLVLPLIALVQLAFAGAERLSRDEAFCLGYVVVARRPAAVPSSRPASRASSPSRGASTTSQS